MAKKTIDVQKVIQVHATPTHDGCWVHTHGMTEFGHPEFEIRGVPTFLANASCGILNNICDYLINGAGARIKAGEKMSLGSQTVFRFAEGKPLHEEENGHYETPRFRVVDVEEFKCQHPEHQEQTTH